MPFEIENNNTLTLDDRPLSSASIFNFTTIEDDIRLYIMFNDNSSSSVGQYEGGGGSSSFYSSSSYYESVDFILDGVILTLISTVGFIGTLMAIRVLININNSSVNHSLGKSSFSSLLLGLASTDASFLLLAIITIGLSRSSMWYATHVTIHVVPISNGLMSIARSGSVYLTVSVTVERFYAIVKPLHHFTAKKYLMPFSLIFAIIYNLPKFFELEKAVFPFTNEVMIQATPLRNNVHYQKYYMFWSKILLIEAIPYSIIVVLNASIIRQIFASKKFRNPKSQSLEMQPRKAGSMNKGRVRKLSRSSEKSNSTHASSFDPQQQQQQCLRIDEEKGFDQDNQNHSQRIVVVKRYCDIELSLARTLIGISTLFVLCQSIKIVPDLYELVCEKKFDQTCMSTPFIDTVISLSNVLSCINSSANFVMYMAQGKKFRSTFIKLYCAWVKPWRSNSHQSSSLSYKTSFTSKSLAISRQNCLSLRNHQHQHRRQEEELKEGDDGTTYEEAKDDDQTSIDTHVTRSQGQTKHGKEGGSSYTDTISPHITRTDLLTLGGHWDNRLARRISALEMAQRMQAADQDMRIQEQQDK